MIFENDAFPLVERTLSLLSVPGFWFEDRGIHRYMSPDEPLVIVRRNKVTVTPGFPQSDQIQQSLEAISKGRGLGSNVNNEVDSKSKGGTKSSVNDRSIVNLDSNAVIYCCTTLTTNNFTKFCESLPTCEQIIESSKLTGNTHVAKIAKGLTLTYHVHQRK